MKPKPSLEKLQKFFKHEASRGYDNKAVMGGLSGMLSTWEAEARHDGVSEEIIQAVGERLRDYEKLTPPSREEVLKGIWKRIRAEEGLDEEAETSPETKSKPGPPPGEKPEEPEEVKSPRKITAQKPRRKKRPKPEGPPAALDG